MGANVTELSRHAEEELVLLAHRLVLMTGCASNLHSLQFHIRVGDFGEFHEEEDDGKEKDKGSNSEICPLHLGDIVGVGVAEENPAGQKRSHDTADRLKALREFQPEFGESRRATGRNEGVRRSLQGRKARTDDEQRTAESTKGPINSGRPKHQGTYAVNAQASDEGPAVAELANDPS